MRRIPLGVTRHWPSLVLLDQAFLLDQLDDLGHLVLEVVHVAEDAVAVLHHVLGELVEDLVGRLRQELLRAVPLANIHISGIGSEPSGPSSTGSAPVRGCRRPWPTC